jgi:hypothetical protein
MLRPVDDSDLVTGAMGAAVVGVKVDADNLRRGHRLAVDVEYSGCAGPVLGTGLAKGKVIVARVVFARVA